jgi:hypothetical protein
MTAQMILDVGPITFTTPSSTRFYFEPGIVLVNSTIDMLEAYSDPFQGKDTLQPQTYIAYSVDLSGNFSQLNGITGWINAFSPQTVPAFSLNYAARAFNGPSSGSDFAEYFDTINMDGTATFRIAVVDMSGASPVVHTLGTSITVNPVSKTLTDNITGELGTLVNGNSLNEEIFEVAGAPSAGTITGTFMIFNSAGSVVFAPSTGFNFTDGKAHVFGVGAWNKTSFGELVEVWNGTTNLADLQLSTINATTGALTTGWTAATELTTITRVRWQFISPGGAGMIVVADGSDAGGRGFFQYVIDDSSVTGGTGGTILKSLATHYTGTVTQDASIFGSGIANEYVLDWVDANGLTLELIDSSLNVLETYNIPEANGTSLLQDLGDGRLFVTYRVQTSTSSVDKYVILDTRLTNPPPPPGTTADMILRHGADGFYEVYDIGSNTILAAGRLGQVGTDWQFVGLGGFFGNDTTDMLLRSSSTGGFEVYDIANNNITNAAFLGAVGLNWQVMGFGNFSSMPGETDMILRNSNTGGVEVYDISNNQITGAAFMGAVGLNWQFSGVGNFSGLGESDMLLRNSNTGGLEVYDIANNQLTGATFIGTVGLDWQFSGVGNFSGVPGETDLLLRNSTTGGLEIYDINNNQITGAAFIGTVGLDWRFAGIAPANGAGTSDLVLRSASTGAFEVYDISNNQLTGAAPLGSVGLDWQLGGFAADPPTTSMGSSGSTSQLVQAMAGVGGGSGAAVASNTVTLGADTSQQPLLTATQHA